jgi:hypothetical protein
MVDMVNIDLLACTDMICCSATVVVCATEANVCGVSFARERWAGEHACLESAGATQ